MNGYDAVVVGSGPNGLAAAITLAEQGLSVKLFEARPSVGGGARTAELTFPGFKHDVCSAVHPMALASPFFRSLRLESFGLRWIQPEYAVAHPLDDGTAVVLPGLGRDPIFESSNSFLHNSAIKSWTKLFTKQIDCGISIFDDMLAPLPFFPRHLLAMARFGLNAMLSAERLAERSLKTPQLRALFAGMAGHSFLAFDRAFSSATALALALAAYLVGWPIPEGGSQSISDALLRHFLQLGGEVFLNQPITSLSELPAAKIVLLDVSAEQFLRLSGDKLPSRYQMQLRRFRPGMAVFKMDWALTQPLPWKAEQCLSAGTIHIGGNYGEIAASEREVSRGYSPQNPFVLLSQPSLFDRTRAPEGKHTLWGYCHVPLNSNVDMTDRIESQIERFAPGFRDCILARHVSTPADVSAYNANFAGGDITGGAVDWPQIFRRPTNWFRPYRTPIKNVFLCSASTPPGPGVHGMCGFHAAKLALQEQLKHV